MAVQGAGSRSTNFLAVLNSSFRAVVVKSPPNITRSTFKSLNRWGKFDKMSSEKAWFLDKSQLKWPMILLEKRRSGFHVGRVK